MFSEFMLRASSCARYRYVGRRTCPGLPSLPMWAYSLSEEFVKAVRVVLPFIVLGEFTWSHPVGINCSQNFTRRLWQDKQWES